MTSDNAQAFFKSNEKDGLRDTSGWTKNVKVRQVVYGGQNSTQTATEPRSRFSDTDKRESDSSYVPHGEYKSLNKPPIWCFLL